MAAGSLVKPWLLPLFALVGAFAFAGPPAAQARHHVGEPLPELGLVRGDGSPVVTPQRDRALVLVFLRGRPQYEETVAREVQEVAARFPSAPLEVHPVVVAADTVDAAPAAASIDAETWFDPERRAVKALDVFVYPTTIVVDRSGVVLRAFPARPPRFPERLQAAVEFALGRIDRAEFERRLNEQDRAPERDPELRKARLLAAFAARLEREGRSEDAWSRFREALRLAPGDVEVVRRAVAFLLAHDRLDEAEERLGGVAGASPEPPALALLRARLLRLRGRLDEAGKKLEKLRSVATDPAAVLFELGRVREAQGRFQEAAELYRDAYEALRTSTSSGSR